ncbi:MAG: sigma-70 family RNA polymerase sigma factor [Oscillospiraceae bacterium]|nr:sigma-70 family RNA polymerase sigma factor [Oscillospiraceae bacterium]
MLGMDEIYTLYFRDVYRYLLALTGDETLAEELTAETFFKALLHLSRFRGDCHIRVWLCQIAKNAWYTHLRKQRKKGRTPAPAEPEELNAPLEDREDAERIRKALEKLREPYQQVFSMRVLSQLPFKEIGAAFGKSEHWACVTYHRAKEQIQKAIGGIKDE